MKLFKIYTFEAAHRLPNVPPEHKCFRLHGHSFRLEIHLEGTVDPNLGWVIDFGDIDRIFQPVLDQLDHHYLNEIPGLENATSENVIRWIWGKLKPLLPQLTRLVLQETCTGGCSYEGEA